LRTRAEHAIATVPIATIGIRTTGRWTNSGCAGRPKSFEMSIPSTVGTDRLPTAVGRVRIREEVAGTGERDPALLQLVHGVVHDLGAGVFGDDAFEVHAASG
jgi:hypothetical protein